LESRPVQVKRCFLVELAGGWLQYSGQEKKTGGFAAPNLDEVQWLVQCHGNREVVIRTVDPFLCKQVSIYNQPEGSSLGPVDSNSALLRCQREIRLPLRVAADGGDPELSGNSRSWATTPRHLEQLARCASRSFGSSGAPGA
jgi:hypothetical protein